MIRNMVVPFIEAKDCKDGNIHIFEIMNAKWVPGSMVFWKAKDFRSSKNDS